MSQEQDARLTALDVATIVAAAATLTERLTGASALPGPPEPPASDEVLADWQRALSSVGEAGVLERRLAWSGWTRDDVAVALRPAEGSRSGPGVLPTWAGVIEQVHHDTIGHFVSPTDRGWSVVDVSQPLPFEELFSGALATGQRLLATRIGRPGDRLSHRIAPSAEVGFGRHLLTQLATLAQAALFAELEAIRPAGKNLTLRITGGPATSDERTLYDRFIESHLREGLARLIGNYPVLARLIGTCIEDWVEATAELVGRLEADWDALRGAWPDVQPNDEVIDLRPGQSDAHHGGRTVAVMRLSGGATLVYKPRSLDIDRATEAFVAACALDGGPRLRTPRVLCRNGYGWMEFIAHRPIRSRADAPEFYRNAGALLFHMYILGGTDGHRENVVACGDQLVLIDTETLLHTEIGARPADAADGTSFDTVLRTGLLPSWQIASDGTARDESGLAGTSAASTPVRTWRALNSDDMHIGLMRTDEGAGFNVPSLDDLALDPRDHVDDLCAGFALTYRSCLLRRAAILDESAGPLSQFRELETRYVFRATSIYESVWLGALQPRVLRSGIRWGLHLELLSRAGLVDVTRPPWWPMVESEIAQMTRLDVPYFASSLEDGVIRVEGEVVAVSSGLTLARRRIESMSERDLDLQLELVRGAFAAQNPRGAMARGGEAPWDHDAGPAALDAATCLTEARAIAEALERRALRRESGARWLGFEYMASSDRIVLDQTTMGLYDGAAGIALFLAAVDRLTNDDRFSTLWREALQPLERLGDSGHDGHRFSRLGIGMATGLGGLIHAAVLLSDLGGPDQGGWLLRSARAVADLFTDELIESGDGLDVIGGSAGAVLGLLTLFGKTHDDRILATATRCGHHLVRRLGPILDDLERGARAAGPSLLTGFSHGAAGMALALARLAHDTPDAGFADVARRAIAYESALYEERAKNWPDLRAGSQGEPMTAWCHGAPGIALGRLAMHALDGDASVMADWKRGVDTTLETGDLGVDHLCCGNMGLAEVLLESGRILARPDLERAALARGTHVVLHARASGAYRLFVGGGSAVFNPGFFQGVAGIGYQLLRLARPTALPSVLTFEAFSARV